MIVDLWNLKRSTTETRWLLAGIYNLILFVVILIPMVASVQVDKEEGVWLVQLLIFLGTTSTVICAVAPRFIVNPSLSPLIQNPLICFVLIQDTHLLSIFIYLSIHNPISDTILKTVS